MKVLDAFLSFMQSETGIATVLEPQALENSEPALRASLAGFDSQGENRERMDLTVVLSTYGDGPDVFLDAVISASRAMVPYREGHHGFEVEPGFIATATFTRTAAGRFEEAEPAEGEPTFRFRYAEPFRVELSYNPANL